MLGPSVEVKEHDHARWMRIPHFIHFYCYSYAFGKLRPSACTSSGRSEAISS